MQSILGGPQLDFMLPDTLDVQSVSSSISASALLYLIPTCAVLVSIEVLMRAAGRKPQSMVAVQAEAEAEAESLPTVETPPSPPAIDPIKAIASIRSRARQVRDDYDQLSRQLEAETRRADQKKRNFTVHRMRMASLPCRPKPDFEKPSPSPEPSQPRKGITPEFALFCERLVAEDKLRKQRQAIKSLRHSLNDARASNSSTAFQAFCDRLLLSNQIWKLQKEVDALTAETDKVQRARVVAVTRAAKQMVHDVRKERMIEEYVKELLEELGDCKRTIAEMKERHETEIQEMAGEFRKSYRQAATQIERLTLARDARLIEQEMSNEWEGELVGRLALREAAFRRRADEELSEVSTEGEYMSETELEAMSNMSATTCVDSAGNPSPSRRVSLMGSTPERKRTRSSMPTPIRLKLESLAARAGSPRSRNSSGSYAGFSFNPLFYGLQLPEADLSTHSLGVRRTQSISEFGAVANEKRPQWRF